MLFNSLTKDLTAITIEIKGYIKGTFLFFIFKESAINLAKMMMKASLNQDSSDDELDEMKDSAIKEFINITLSTFVEAIANTLNKKIIYRLGEKKVTDVNFQIAEALATVNARINGEPKIKHILSTDIGIDALDTTIQGVCFFLMEKEEETIQSSLDESEIKKDKVISTAAQQTLNIDKTLPTKEACIDVLDNFFPGEGKTKVEDAMEKLHLGGFKKISTGIKQNFINAIIHTYFEEYSDNVSTFVRQSLSQILGIASLNEGDLGPEKELKKQMDREMMERMMRDDSD